LTGCFLGLRAIIAKNRTGKRLSGRDVFIARQGGDKGVAASWCIGVVCPLGPVDGRIKRTQRLPQYSDEELAPWFAEVAKGYSFEQAAERCKLVWKWVENTVYSDDEVFEHGLNLSMVAGAKIRAGLMSVPDRHDKLYEEFR
jgi:hypothetical protein